MTFEELTLLKTTEARQLIAENEKTDPSLFALKYRQPVLATQVKYWQRSRLKLPSIFAAQGIVPPLAFEQCSSELAAAAKDITGKLCLDLTCGLGIDTLHFSKCFEKVISIERNEVLAEVVRYNFELMGIKNVEIISNSAENYLKNYTDEPFDLIYIDPARRDDAGKKIFLPQHCSPNIIELMPILKKIGHRILVKMSPMYDLDAAIREFPDMVSVGVLSLDNECKEVWLEFKSTPQTNILNPKVFVKIGQRNIFWTFEKKENIKNNEWLYTEGGYSFVIEPDVAFYKARMLPTFYDFFLINTDTYLTAQSGFFLTKQKMAKDMPARCFCILSEIDYQPKKILLELKRRNITEINVIQRNFPFTTQQIRTALKMQEGGDFFLICTLCEGKKKVWLTRFAS